ncbi:MAG: hypothetical protein ACWA5P_05085 [bacterium]
MVYGGTGSMNIVLKNNRNLLAKRKRFEGLVSSNSGKIETANFHKEVSKEYLLKLRNRLQEENKNRRYRIWSIFGLIASIIIACALYYM